MHLAYFTTIERFPGNDYEHSVFLLPHKSLVLLYKRIYSTQNLRDITRNCFVLRHLGACTKITTRIAYFSPLENHLFDHTNELGDPKDAPKDAQLPYFTTLERRHENDYVHSVFVPLNNHLFNRTDELK